MTKDDFSYNKRARTIRLIRTREDFSEVFKHNSPIDYERVVVAVYDANVNETLLKSQLHQLHKSGILYTFKRQETNGALSLKPQLYFDCRRVA